MTDPLPPEVQRSRRGWILWGMIGVVVLLGLFRLAYPALRARQLIGCLRDRGFQVTTSSVLSDWSMGYVTGLGDDRLIRTVTVSKDRGPCNDADVALLSELFQLTHDGIKNPAQCTLRLC